MDSDQGVNILHGITHLVYSNVKPLAQEAQDLGLFPPITSVEPSSIPLPSVPTYTPSFVTMTVPSIPMSVPLMSLPNSQHSYHHVPSTYSTPMPTIVPSVPPVVSSILATSYTLHGVSNVSIPPISSHDSTIISLAQNVSSLQQKVDS